MKLIDFDGTLVDLWPRYHAVFCDLLEISGLTIEEYRAVKQKLMKDKLVAEYIGKKLPEDYFKKKIVALEQKEYLKYDQLLLTNRQIEDIFKEESLLLTKRRYPVNLEWELKQWGLSIPFQAISEKSKIEWLSERILNKVMVVGDSVADLEMGRLRKVEVLMVGYGIGTKEQFDKLSIPYQYIETPQALYDFLICYKKAL